MSEGINARDTLVTVSAEGVSLRRSGIAASLSADATIALSELLAWDIRVPTDLSPGWVDILTEVGSSINSHRVLFSPGHAAECRLVDEQLMALQAGYDIPSANTVSSSVSGKNQPSAARPAAMGGEKKKGGAPEKSGAAPAWKKFSTPSNVPETNTHADITHPIYGQVVCVTGDTAPHDKGEVWNMIAARGGTVVKSVTKKTTMLILGHWDSMTSKEKRARELQQQGQKIELIPFSDFLTMLE